MRTIYIPFCSFEKKAINYNVCHPSDVNFGKSRTYAGFGKKMIEHGYRKIGVSLKFSCKPYTYVNVIAYIKER